MSIDSILLGLIVIAEIIDTSIMIYHNKPKGIPLSAVVAPPAKVEAIAKAADAPVAAHAPASSAGIPVTISFATCATCHNIVARFTPTPEGPVCANCLPIK